MTKRLTISTFVCAVLLSAACYIQTYGQEVKEDFNYPDGLLDNQGTATDGWAGPWIDSSGQIYVKPTSIKAGSGAKHAETLKSDPKKDVQYFRDLNKIWLENAPDTAWISYYGKQYGVGPGWGGLSLFIDEGENFMFGTNWNTDEWGCSVGNTNTYATTPKSCTNPSWLVVQIIVDASMSTTINTWVDPDPTKVPSVSNAYITIENSQDYSLATGFNRVRLGAGIADIQLGFGSIRISKHFSTLNGIKELNPSEINLNVYPNPFSESTKITFKNTANEKYSFSVYDISGNMIKRIENITNGEVVLKSESIANGMYFYKLQNSQGASANGKFIIQK